MDVYIYRVRKQIFLRDDEYIYVEREKRHRTEKKTYIHEREYGCIYREIFFFEKYIEIENAYT